MIFFSCIIGPYGSSAPAPGSSAADGLNGSSYYPAGLPAQQAHSTTTHDQAPPTANPHSIAGPAAAAAAAGLITNPFLPACSLFEIDIPFDGKTLFYLGLMSLKI